MTVYKGEAPGRLDVMGGFGDYSGSLVLQMPIANRTKVQFIPRQDNLIYIKSLADHQELRASFQLNDFPSDDSGYESIRNYFINTNQHWAAYIVGCALLLKKEKSIDFRGGDFLVESDVPLGKGVSSSASVEVATMKALQNAFSIKIEGPELARLAQKVENLIVGAPCGLMDQLASYFGKPGSLLPITCQPDTLHSLITIPNDIHFIGIDSGVRHAVSGSSYTDVRCAAFMGYSIIAQRMGASIDELRNAKISCNWSALPLKGYLSNLTIGDFEKTFINILPERISGKDFIRQFKLHTDAVTEIKPEVVYAIRYCASHPVYENERVHRFKQILESMSENVELNQILQLGELMYQSHQAYNLCEIGSSKTDEIVELAKQSTNIYGAKITGGGSGGTVCLLAYGDEGIESAKKIHLEMEKRTGKKLQFIL